MGVPANATPAGSAAQPNGWGDTWGGQFVSPIDYTAKAASYVGGTGGGEGPLDPKAFGCPNGLRFVIGGGSEDFTLIAVPFCTGTGYGKWYLRYYVSTTGAELANGQSVAGIKFKIFAIGV